MVALVPALKIAMAFSVARSLPQMCLRLGFRDATDTVRDVRFRQLINVLLPLAVLVALLWELLSIACRLLPVGKEVTGMFTDHAIVFRSIICAAGSPQPDGADGGVFDINS
jgi:hypothetical protein